MSVRVEAGDVLEVIPRLVAEGVQVDAVVTDPPYGLEFMGKDWDKFGEAKPRTSTERADHLNRSASHGPWGRRDRPIAPNDYGHRNEKCLLCGKWRISSNRCQCPKPQFESRLRREAPPAMRAYQEFSEAWALTAWDILRPGGYLITFGGTRTHHRMVCAIEDAGFTIQDTIGWLYGSGFPKHKTQLKPAFEPICLAYKPGDQRTMQVDECRIAGAMNGSWGNGKSAGSCWSPNRTNGAREPEGRKHDLGRWPANIVHDGSDEVLAAFPETTSGKLLPSHNAKPSANIAMKGGNYAGRIHSEFGGDNGSAARFFFSAKANAEDRFGSLHPTVKPVDLISWLVKLVCPPGGTFIDPFAGSGTAGVAALATGRNAILIEREPQYIADIEARLAHWSGDAGHSLNTKTRSAKSVGSLPLFE